MKRFTGLLQDLNSRLNVPQPGKSRIILEIADDMEGLYEHYLSTGMNENEAEQKIKEKFTFNDEALLQLKKVHESFIQRMLNKLPGQAATFWERIVLLVLFILLMLFLSGTLLTTSFYNSASTFIWPVLALGFCALLLAFFNFYRLYLKNEYSFKKIRTELTWIFYLGVLILLISIWGYFYEQYISGSIPAGNLISILFIKDHQTAQVNLAVIIECLVKSSSVIITGLFTLVTNGFFLIILTRKLEKTEFAEAMLFLNNNQ